MSKYRTNFVKGRNGQTVYAVEEYYPEENEWGIVKYSQRDRLPRMRNSLWRLTGEKIRSN